MPGMNTGINLTDPTVVAAFRSALLHQGLVILAVLVALALAWIAAREWLAAGPAGRPRAGAKAAAAQAGGPACDEPRGRSLLRICFGLLWILDGLLQAQPAMPAGLPADVMKPAAATSPGWVQHLVNWAGTAWSYHPVQAAAAAVWIQLGIGIWLVAAPRGWPSRLAGLASAGWGLLVWVFGEAFGGIFAPGLTWLFGAPGAVLFYCVAGGLIGLPERSWRSRRLGRLVLDGMGLFFIGMAVLQAWPGRGFWQGTRHHQPGTLTAMVRQMSGTPQPRFLAAWVSGFGSLVGAHGFAVNLVAVIALAAVGAGLMSRRTALVRAALAVAAVLCLADWLLIEDLGFLGGLGTDPNSMIPMFALLAGGYTALTRVPAVAAAPAGAEPEAAAKPEAAAARAEGAAKPEEPAAPGQRPRWAERLRPAQLGHSLGAVSLQAILATWAVILMLAGVVPMAAAQASPTASTILAQAIDGSFATLTGSRAPAFRLTDTNGRPLSLASLHGKIVLLTFLDPVCTSDCPLIAQEFRQADLLLGAQAKRVQMVAVATNPVYYTTAYTRAFDRQEGMDGLANWHFVTGSLVQLQRVWRAYGVEAYILPAGGMIGHTDVAWAINSRGETKAEMQFNPGPGTQSTEASFAAQLVGVVRQLEASR